MRKLLICIATLGCIVSCEVEETINDINTQDDQRNFEKYNNVDIAIDGFDQLSEKAFIDIQGATKSSSSGCITLELLVPYQENPISGFDQYDYYNQLILDYTNDSCQLDDWTGRLEYYVAGVFQSKWKDSTSFKNIRGADGYVFDGYRVAEQNIDLSTESTQVYDVIIDGVITEPDGSEFHYMTRRNFMFENRFTSDEIIVLKEVSSLVGINEAYEMRTNSLEDKPIVFKLACFDRSSFLRYPVEGSQAYTTNFGVNFTIDFGNGTCDKEVTLIGDDGTSIVFDL